MGEFGPSGSLLLLLPAGSRAGISSTHQDTFSPWALPTVDNPGHWECYFCCEDELLNTFLSALWAVLAQLSPFSLYLNPTVGKPRERLTLLHPQLVFGRWITSQGELLCGPSSIFFWGDIARRAWRWEGEGNVWPGMDVSTLLGDLRNSKDPLWGDNRFNHQQPRSFYPSYLSCSKDGLWLGKFDQAGPSEQHSKSKLGAGNIWRYIS